MKETETTREPAIPSHRLPGTNGETHANGQDVHDLPSKNGATSGPFASDVNDNAHREAPGRVFSTAAVDGDRPASAGGSARVRTEISGR